jgi:hypothetical protein
MIQKPNRQLQLLVMLYNPDLDLDLALVLPFIPDLDSGPALELDWDSGQALEMNQDSR